MIKKLLKYGNTYTAVEHSEQKCFSILQLVQKKKELAVVERKIVANQEQVIETLKGQKHFFLILNDEQVLAKKLDTTETNKKKIVQTAFPNIVLSDFYYQVYAEDTYSFVAIARKETIDSIINAYLKAGLFVIDFSIGNLAIANLIGLQENQSLSTSNANIYFKNKGIASIEKKAISSTTYTINDLKVNNQEVLSLAGIIGYYTAKASSDIQKELAETYLQKRFFELTLKTGLGFLLVVLLVNFFAFSTYRDQVGTLSGELQMRQTYKVQLEKLQKAVTQKKQLVQGIQSGATTSISKYYDELGVSLPKTSKLSQLHYQPKNGIQKDDKPLHFQKEVIIVKGASKNDEAFTKWISFLEQKPWIIEISIVSYGRGKNRMNIANFEFIIKLNDN